MFETGYFASLWRDVALKLGLAVDFVSGDWRQGVDPAVIEKMLAADRRREIKAVAVVHNETSTGATSRVREIRKAIDRAGHPAPFWINLTSLGTGLGRLKGRVFRIGHLGDFNDLMLAGTLGGVEMGLSLAGVPFSKGGVAAALDFLSRRCVH
jgi:aspartate aminotransferase-like enzyme